MPAQAARTRRNRDEATELRRIFSAVTDFKHQLFQVHSDKFLEKLYAGQTAAFLKCAFSLQTRSNRKDGITMWMKNRSIFKIPSILFFAIVFTPGCYSQGTQVVPDVPSAGPIGYINPDIPEVSAPDYQGGRYETLVPATLDLAERGALAVNAMTEMLNPNCDYEAYWAVDLISTQPWMHHNYSDHVRIKYLQALPLCRTISGSNQNLDREKAILECHLKMQGPDGLIYTPFIGRPWGKVDETTPANWLTWAGVLYHPSQPRPQGDQLACFTFDNGRALGAFSVYALKDPQGPWKEVARKLAEALKKWVVVEDDIAYLSALSTVPGRKPSEPEAKPTKYSASIASQTAHGLAQYGRLLGDPEAIDLASKMMRYILRDSKYFGPNGEFLTDMEDPDEHSIHFHTHTMAILAALEVVLTTQEQDLLEMSHKAYNYAIQRGNPVVGYFPEHLNYILATSETCEVADMAMSAIALSKLGIDEWDHADRWIRNQLAANQLDRIGWIFDGHFEPIERNMEGYYYTTDRVAQRALGCFAGHPSANDWQGKTSPCASVSNCCTVNGEKSLYYIWKNILSEEDGTLKVNLLLNRASKWADIDSYVPYEGRVDISVKRDIDLEVRIPEWTELEDVKCEVDGQDIDMTFDGRYAQVGEVSSGQEATLSFPISERTQKVAIQGREYTLIIRGNTVVNIDPPGFYHPLYRRGHYRAGPTLWKKVERFVPEDELRW